MRLINAEPIEKSIAEWKARETNEPLTKTIVDNVGTWITHAPTVEAIPISWIEEWLKKMPKHTTPYFYKRFLKNAIRGMVKDWRQENEE